jgi:hypothetical protein
MTYERFSAEIFSRPFLVVKAAPAGLSGRFVLASIAFFPTRSKDSFLKPSALVRQFQNPSIMRPSRVFGKKMSVILIHGFLLMERTAARRNAFGAVRRSQRRRWRCQTSADMATEIYHQTSLGGIAVNFVKS